MTDRISRKAFLRNGTVCLAGFAAGRLPAGAGPAAKPQAPPWPWPYKALDPEAVRKAAHDSYYEQGCGYGGFAGIVGQLRAAVGEPFTSLPLEIMSYASGGIKGWGTVCGALNGASAAISLVCDGKASARIIDELILWYMQSPLPTEASNGYGEQHRFNVDRKISRLPQTVSGSPLCHVSATTWCKAAGRTIESPERLERCARLSGDVAAFAAALLNDNLAGRMRSTYALPQQTSECLACHGAAGQVRNVAAKIECGQCHKPSHPQG